MLPTASTKICFLASSIQNCHVNPSPPRVSSRCPAAESHHRTKGSRHSHHTPFHRKRHRLKLQHDKMVKTKKKTTDNINSRLNLVVRSGKYTLGFKSTIRTLRSGKSKLVLIASNAAPLRKSELEYYAMLAKCPVYHFQGNNIDLGTLLDTDFRQNAACGAAPCWCDAMVQHRNGFSN